MFVDIFSFLTWWFFYFLINFFLWRLLFDCIFTWSFTTWLFLFLLLVNLNWYGFLQLFILFDFIDLAIKGYWTLIIFQQWTKVYLLEKLSLSLKSIINVCLIFLVIWGEKTLTKVGLLGITAKRIKFICAYCEVVDQRIVMKFNLVVIFLEFFNKSVNQYWKMLRFISYWRFKSRNLLWIRFFFSKLVNFLFTDHFFMVFIVDKLLNVNFKLIFEKIQSFYLLNQTCLNIL